MFRDYQKEGYIKGINKQHDIMIFIGNGFDISVLRKYRNDNLVSSYSKFYDYLCYKDFYEDNILFKKMKKDKSEKKDNWSDFECSLEELLQTDVLIEELDKALSSMQNSFLLFLNEIVTPEILVKLNNDAEINKWGNTSLSEFLGDLDKEDYLRINFPEKTSHYNMYDFLFVNFNYTSLFDNYIYLDKGQFEPKPHKTVETNFMFYPNPNGYKKAGKNKDTRWSSFVMINTIHPHGYQNIPRSLLFGTENAKFVSKKELNKFNKSYWAQDNQKYKSYFDKAELFIIYGTSIGKTDSWWWQNVIETLLKRDSELIIYYYNNYHHYKKDYVKQMFIDACKVNLSEEEILKVKEKTYVVLYNNSNELNLFGL